MRVKSAVWVLALSVAALVSGCSVFSSPASPAAGATTDPSPEPALTTTVTDDKAAAEPDAYRLQSGREAYEKGDYFKAMNELYPLAASSNQADPEAQRLVGVMFMRGLSVPVNPELGRVWLMRSAEQGNVQAQWLLGRSLSMGKDLPQDRKQALTWLERAANNGLAEAQFYLAGLYQRREDRDSDQKAFRWMLAAANQGHLAAQNSVGLMYLQGVGVARDNSRAEAWLLKAASADLASAQYHLSRYYAGGGQQANALGWLRKAAANGHGAALQRVLEAPGQGVTMTGHLSLFGIPLVMAERDVLRKRILQAGGIALRQEDSRWYDVYEASALINGADRLFVGYSLSNLLPGELRYRFPEMNTPAGVATLIDRISDKYGPPAPLAESYELNGLHARWVVEDATIEVRHSWPDDALALRFVLKEQLAAIRDEQSGRGTMDERGLRLETY